MKAGQVKVSVAVIQASSVMAKLVTDAGALSEALQEFALLLDPDLAGDSLKTFCDQLAAEAWQAVA